MSITNSIFILQDAEVQTDPPPSTTFSANVGLGNIFDAYEKDYEVVLIAERERERLKQQKKEMNARKGVSGDRGKGNW